MACDAWTGTGLKGILENRHPQDINMMPEELWKPRLETLAKVALQKQKQGETVDPFDLKPLYVRRSAAEEKADGV
ncbi:MAG: hypothetical protein R3C03_00735 [Pirellulaceae bacterium]